MKTRTVTLEICRIGEVVKAVRLRNASSEKIENVKKTLINIMPDRCMVRERPKAVRVKKPKAKVCPTCGGPMTKFDREDWCKGCDDDSRLDDQP